MKEARLQFSLQRLLLATACFAVAFAAAGYVFQVLRIKGQFGGWRGEFDMPLIGLSPYAICMGFGTGVGLLIDRAEAGMMLGFFTAPLFYCSLPIVYQMLF